MSSETTHPLYGPYTPGHRATKFAGYTINDRCEVIGPRGDVLRAKNETVAIGGKCTPVTHLALLTFFPAVLPKETVDHADEDHTNNMLSNLRWMTRGENTRKSNEVQVRDGAARRKKPICLLDGPRGNRVRVLASAVDAAREFGADRSCILLSVRTFDKMDRTHASAKGQYYAPIVEPDLPGETWIGSEALDIALVQTDTPADRKVNASNLGRVRLTLGRKTFGNRGGHGSAAKVRYVDVKQRAWPVHQIVFMAHMNRAVPVAGEVDAQGRQLCIRRDPAFPLDADGCYSTAIASLRLGVRGGKAQKRAAADADTNASDVEEDE